MTVTSSVGKWLKLWQTWQVKLHWNSQGDKRKDETQTGLFPPGTTLQFQEFSPPPTPDSGEISSYGCSTQRASIHIDWYKCQKAVNVTKSNSIPATERTLHSCILELLWAVKIKAEAAKPKTLFMNALQKEVIIQHFQRIYIVIHVLYWTMTDLFVINLSHKYYYFYSTAFYTCKCSQLSLKFTVVINKSSLYCNWILQKTSESCFYWCIS